jgi:hypothetical protein
MSTVLRVDGFEVIDAASVGGERVLIIHSPDGVTRPLTGTLQ